LDDIRYRLAKSFVHHCSGAASLVPKGRTESRGQLGALNVIRKKLRLARNHQVVLLRCPRSVTQQKHHYAQTVLRRRCTSKTRRAGLVGPGRQALPNVSDNRQPTTQDDISFRP
jgi:hypothetical protein